MSDNDKEVTKKLLRYANECLQRHEEAEYALMLAESELAAALGDLSKHLEASGEVPSGGETPPSEGVDLAKRMRMIFTPAPPPAVKRARRTVPVCSPMSPRD
jgi:hypothetical protein